MKYNRASILVAALVVLADLFGCASDSDLARWNYFPSEELLLSKGEKVLAAFDALAEDVSRKDELPILGSKCVSLRVLKSYHYDGEVREVAFSVVLGNLGKITSPFGPVREGMPIGLAGETHPVLVITCASLDPYLVGRCPVPPARAAGAWWFNPRFLFENTTDWFSFPQTDDLGGPMKEIESHIRSENVSHQTFLNERRCFPTVLDEYPAGIDRETAEWLAPIEKGFYRKTGQILFTQLISHAGEKVRLCWQKDFLEYLRQEYAIGKPVWLYGNLVSFNPERDEFIFFIRDFAGCPIKEIVEDRIGKIMKNYEIPARKDLTSS
jgi:hypothetical protein